MYYVSVGDIQLMKMEFATFVTSLRRNERHTILIISALLLIFAVMTEVVLGWDLIIYTLGIIGSLTTARWIFEKYVKNNNKLDKE